MRKNLVFLVAIAIALSIVGVANGYSEPEVIILKDKDIYTVGEDVSLTINFFKDGSYVDLDENPTIKLNYYSSSNERTIDTMKDTNGIYKAKFTIQESDIYYSSYYSYIPIEVEYYYNGNSYSDSGQINVKTNLIAECIVSNEFPTKGEKVDITFKLRYDGSLIDADNVNIAIAKPFDYYGSKQLNYQKTELGTYKTSYTIPSNLTSTTLFVIMASFSYNSKITNVQKILYVKLYSYEVWMHILSKSETNAEFELWVSDSNGKGVSNVQLNIEYYKDYTYSGEKTKQTQTTDSQGKAVFYIEHNNRTYISFDGTYKKDGKEGEFSGHIDITPYSSSSGISIEDKNDISEMEKYKVGNTVSKEYTVYYDGVISSNKEIYYYIYTKNTMIKYGKVISDANGKITLSFTIPNTDRIYTKFSYESGSQSKTIDVIDSNLQISVDKFSIGEKFNVSAITEYSGNAMVFVVPIEDGEATWIPISSFNLIGLTSMMKKDGNKYTTEMILPEFLPKDKEYVVLVGIYDLTTQEFHYNLIRVNVGESANSKTTSETPKTDYSLYIISIAVISGILLISIFIASQLRKNRQQTYPNLQQPQMQYPQQIQSVKKINVFCPKCNSIIESYSNQREIICYNCGQRGILSQIPIQYQQSQQLMCVKCPNCQAVFGIIQGETTVQCPNCGMRGNLGG